ncbi:MAG: putative sulfate/molybdate transporter [Ignavibacteriales bacterium]|nr:putative sulfate/molybdate transporter [Ignavibacteriales bacterium]
MKAFTRNRIRFDRNELAGSFGDIGTDLPLIVGIILAAGLDSASVFIMFGLMQILTGIVYGIPMPMQPLKAMAVLVITQKIAGPVLFGAGISVGIIMLFLTITGGLTLLIRWIPPAVVRGIQFGLGLSLASLALKDYVPSMGLPGYGLALAGMFLMILLWGNRRIPPGLLVIGIGVLYALVVGLHMDAILGDVRLALPQFRVPGWDDILTGTMLLALPQIPLSISNSVIATEKTIHDLFPERSVKAGQIGLTYSIVNLIAPFFGGIPVCHGCGGLAGHYTFGARTGGAVIIYGTFYLLTGLFFSGPLYELLKIFPRPILGVVLLFEALTLLSFIRDQSSSSRNLLIALLTGLIAFTVPQGFAVALVLGCIVFYAAKRFGERPNT